MIALNPTRRITIRLALVADPQQRAWLCLHVQARDDDQVRAVLDLAGAIGTAAATAPQRTILKTEIMGGVITAKRRAKRGCVIELVGLGGEVEPTGDTLIQVPSIAFAVAANLAVLHGLGVVDLRATPQGGYGWRLEAVEVSDVG
jgi:hypothetical protein